MQYKVNNHPLEYICEGPTQIGSNTTLLEGAIDLTRSMPWHIDGYSIQNFPSSLMYSAIQANAKQQLLDIWKGAGLEFDSSISPDSYHTLVTDQEAHLRVVNEAKLISVKKFPVEIKQLEETVSQLLNQPVRVHNPFDHQEVFHYRIIRPQSGDNNPLHRDTWLEDYKDCINLYIPITGSDENSSLIIAKGSHLWPESKIERTQAGALINGQQFNVPAVTRMLGPVEFVRPDPRPGQFLIFSPYLVHGGSVNLNLNKTRISIEIRLWRK